MPETSVKTVDRLVRILDSFDADRASWSLADLSDHLDIPKSTLHRFMGSLKAHGVLTHNLDTQEWSLGNRLMVWGSAAMQVNGLSSVVRPIMRALSSAVEETVILTIYCNREVVCLDTVASRHVVRLAMSRGARRPPHAGASCKVLMAYLSDQEITDVIRHTGLPRLCKNTITDPGELRVELARIRQRGYAHSKEETDLAAWGVAVPIRNQAGEVIAAIGTAGPLSRLNTELLQGHIEHCQNAAEQIRRSAPYLDWPATV